MSRSPSPDARALSGERERLEQAHHDICTALTVLMNNVELVRSEIRRDASEHATRVAVHAHLDDVEWANERLHQVARNLRAWHERC